MHDDKEEEDGRSWNGRAMTFPTWPDGKWSPRRVVNPRDTARHRFWTADSLSRGIACMHFRVTNRHSAGKDCARYKRLAMDTTVRLYR